MDHRRHPAGAVHEALAELARLVVAVPVEAFGEVQTLRGIQAQAVDVGDEQQQAGQALAALGDPELGRLLDRVLGVQTGRRQPDDLGARRLRLKQERGIVVVVQRMADGPQHLAARGLDGLGGVFLKRIAEGVVGGQEEPAVAAGLHDRAAGAHGQRVGVIGPVEAVGGAGLARQVRGAAAGHDVDLLLLARDRLHGQRHGRGGQVHDRVHLLGVEPLPGDGRADVGLVLVVGADDLDRGALHGAAEILDRHLRGFERALPAQRRIRPRHVVQDADLDDVVRDFGVRGRSHQRGRADGHQDVLHASPPQVPVRPA